MPLSAVQGLVEQPPDAVVVISAQGEVLYWSAGAEQTFGYPEDEAVGRSLEALVVPVEWAALLREATVRALTESKAAFRTLWLQKEGVRLPVSVELYPLANEARADILCAIHFDTDRKRPDDKFRALLEAAPDAMVIVNGEGRIVLVNSQTESLFGYERTELLNQPVEILVPERLRDRHSGHRGTYFNLPNVRPMGAGLALFGQRKDGTEFPVEISLSPLATEEGMLVSSSIRDVTERKAFEAQLQETNLKLEAASRSKDRFLASMSHELRTPLNAIIGFTGTLLMRLPGPLTPDQEQQLRTVQASARHLLSLINDLLDLAKIESGTVTLHHERVVCQEVLADVSAQLRPLAEGKSLAFALAVPPEPVVLESDRRALTQILINLVNNAIKFTESGSVRIELETREAGEGRHVEIRVIDTGVGIRVEDQVRLFRSFERVQAAHARPTEGTGLGLYLSRKLAELLGATIGVTSDAGRGSTFTLRVPERTAADPASRELVSRIGQEWHGS